uniref:DUF19 domain-containing protein n=1 Tax=Caenorhabditis tropicalis TaxID=1561998 RepID=A0A1I7V2M5_9PELO
MKPFLFLILIYLPFAFSSTCSTTDQIKFLQCKGSIIKIQDLLKLYAPYTETPVPTSVFKQISKLCARTAACIKTIECAEAKKGVSMMDFACGGIEMSSGPFGDCMAKLQTTPIDSRKFPCAPIFEKDALDSITKGCKMITEDVQCVKGVAEKYCGTVAVEAFKKGIPFMKDLMKCE